MNKIRYLHIIFSEPIQSYDIPKFRAAVIEKTKRESTLFHNHIDDNAFIYRYPLIQYKVTDKKASMVCLAEMKTDRAKILSKMDNLDKLNRQLQWAIEREDYEDAARLREKIQEKYEK